MELLQIYTCLNQSRIKPPDIGLLFINPPSSGNFTVLVRGKIFILPSQAMDVIKYNYWIHYLQSSILVHLYHYAAVATLMELFKRGLHISHDNYNALGTKWQNERCYKVSLTLF